MLRQTDFVWICDGAQRYHITLVFYQFANCEESGEIRLGCVVGMVGDVWECCGYLEGSAAEVGERANDIDNIQ